MGSHHTFHFNSNSVMYVNNIEPEVFLPPGSENFNHNASRNTSSRSRSHNVNNNIVPVSMNSMQSEGEQDLVFHSEFRV